MKEELRTFIREKISVDQLQPHPVSGGSINEAWHLAADGQQYFCKVNSNRTFPALFQKEINGLRKISSTGTILTPSALQAFEWNDTQLLLMEWIEPGLTNHDFWRVFGRQLADLHRHTSNQCGFEENNYMGSIPQSNSYRDSWSAFFVENRLMPMVNATSASGRLDKEHREQFETLYKKLPSIFNDDDFSLLHGDLWNGNFLVNRDSLPVLIDPAVYYGHRCVDIGMTKLFGGFDEGFYDAYDESYPLPPNYEEQCDVCNLYPLLVHLELFGRSYLGQIETILRKYS